MQTMKRVKKYTEWDDVFTKMSAEFVGESHLKSGWTKNSNLFHGI